MAEVTEQIKHGDIIVKTRKRRSDAGQSRGGKQKLSDKENAQLPQKKAKQAQKQLLPKSNAIIATDDEDEDGEGEEGEGLKMTMDCMAQVPCCTKSARPSASSLITILFLVYYIIYAREPPFISPPPDFMVFCASLSDM